LGLRYYVLLRNYGPVITTYYFIITTPLLLHYYTIITNEIFITTIYYQNMTIPLLHITLLYYPITTILLHNYYPITMSSLHNALLRHGITTPLLHHYSDITSPLLHWPVVLLRITFLQLFAAITSPLLLIITQFHYFLMQLLRITTITTITTHYYPGQLADGGAARGWEGPLLASMPRAGAAPSSLLLPPWNPSHRPIEAAPNFNIQAVQPPLVNQW
jgi:hypothetical protein